jgi:hypothetical protein
MVEVDKTKVVGAKEAEGVVCLETDGVTERVDEVAAVKVAGAVIGAVVGQVTLV